jgi:hypothetical protein
MVDLPAFEKRFERSFNRVYAFVAARVPDRGAVERVTRDVLHRSLESLLAEEDGGLDAVLLRNTNRALSEEAARRAPRAG